MRRRQDRFRTRRWTLAISITCLVAAAAVGLIAYRANTGLPWASRYLVTVEVPDADRLIRGADVRIAGIRVGYVLGFAAETSDREPHARLRLALEPSAAPLPTDTTARVRPASVLGLTYVELHLGRNSRTIASGATLPLRPADESVHLNDLFEIFDNGKDLAFRRALDGLASGFAGRGTSVNTTIAAFGRSMPALTHVSAELAAPNTGLGRFLSGYEATVSALEPVSPQLAALVRGAATTFGALANERESIGALIDAAPPAELATTAAFRAARPALDGLGRIAVDLRPAGRMLPKALGNANSTLDAALPAMREIPSFAVDLRSALAAVRDLSRDPNTSGSLRKLADLAPPTDEVTGVLLPAQVHCGLLSQWSLNFGSAFAGLGVGEGPGLGNLGLTTAGAFGEPVQNAKPSANVGVNPLPNENSRECESGNEPWSQKQKLNNPPGRQRAFTRETVPPPGVTERVRRAGLLDPIEGAAGP